MLLTFNGFSSMFMFISGCPGSCDLTLVYRYTGNHQLILYETITKNVLKRIIITVEVRDKITEFLSLHKINTYDTIEVFIELLGFVPVHVEGAFPSGVYRGAEFSNVAAFYNKRKPVIYTTLLNIQLPIAYIKNMSTVVQLCLDMDCEITDIKLDVFPDVIQKHIVIALKKLQTDETQTVEDAFIYDYLGLLDHMSEKFVYGDELLDLCNTNVIKCGYHIEDPQIVKLCVRLRVAHLEAFDKTLLNDNILRLLTPYKCVKRVYERSFTELDVLSMQLYIRDRKV